MSPFFVFTVTSSYSRSSSRPSGIPSAVTLTRSPSRQIIGGIAPALDRVKFARLRIPIHQRQRDILRVHLTLQQNLVQTSSSAVTDALLRGASDRSSPLTSDP